MIDLSGIVVSMADTTLTVARHTSAWGTDGRMTDATSTVTVRAMVVPSRRGVRTELQGEASTGTVDVYAATRLETGDTFSYAGGTYQVDTVAGYEATGNFCVAVAKRVPS